jgi:hypothetical protein
MTLTVGGCNPALNSPEDRGKGGALPAPPKWSNTGELDDSGVQKV